MTAHPAHDGKTQNDLPGHRQSAGVNILFDPDYTSKRIQVDLNNVSLLDGLRIVAQCPILTGTRSPAIPSLWPPTPAPSNSELDEAAVETFYLTNAWQQNDLNDVQTALRKCAARGSQVYGVAQARERHSS